MKQILFKSFAVFLLVMSFSFAVGTPAAYAGNDCRLQCYWDEKLDMYVYGWICGEDPREKEVPQIPLMPD